MDRGKKTVMIVDDEPDTVESLALLLEFEGFRCIRAIGGRQALQLIDKKLPDLIVLDLMMPDISGWQVLKEIRNTPTTKDLPLILMSATRISDTQNLSKTWQEFVSKPFKLEELLHTIDRLLKIQEASI